MINGKFYLASLVVLICGCIFASEISRSLIYPDVPTKFRISNGTSSPTLFLTGRIVEVSGVGYEFEASLDGEALNKKLFKATVEVDELFVTGTYVFDHEVSEHFFSSEAVEFQCYFEKMPNLTAEPIPIVLEYYPSIHAKVARNIYQFDSRRSMLQALEKRKNLRVKINENFPEKIVF
ncbi:MAG: hypothetical protein WD342_19085 [Verrucomicrobiales bacterium]